MLLAERPVSENDIIIGAHVGRGLEFAYNGTAWIPTYLRGGFGHEIGIQVIPTFPPRTNCAGGRT